MRRCFLKLILLTLFFAEDANAQSNCEEKFNSDDVLRWRKQTEFTPKYHTVREFDYLLSKLSDRAYLQFHIEVSVSCADEQRKQNNISNMYYFWDKKVLLVNIMRYYPAFYVFYKLDKMGLENK